MGKWVSSSRLLPVDIGAQFLGDPRKLGCCSKSESAGCVSRHPSSAGSPEARDVQSVRLDQRADFKETDGASTGALSS